MTLLGRASAVAMVLGATIWGLGRAYGRAMERDAEWEDRNGSWWYDL